MQRNRPPLNLDGVLILNSGSVKYIRIEIDRRVTWHEHIKNKRKQLDLKFKQLL